MQASPKCHLISHQYSQTDSFSCKVQLWQMKCGIITFSKPSLFQSDVTGSTSFHHFCVHVHLFSHRGRACCRPVCACPTDHNYTGQIYFNSCFKYFILQNTTKKKCRSHPCHLVIWSWLDWKDLHLMCMHWPCSIFQTMRERTFPCNCLFSRSDTVYNSCPRTCFQLWRLDYRNLSVLRH